MLSHSVKASSFAGVKGMVRAPPPLVRSGFGREAYRRERF